MSYTCERQSANGGMRDKSVKELISVMMRIYGVYNEYFVNEARGSMANETRNALNVDDG